jgi:hypothetical protein
MQVIEVKPVHGGWKVIDAAASPGWMTVFPGADGLDWAIRYAMMRQAFDGCEIRVLSATGDVVDTIHISETKNSGRLPQHF